MKIPLRKSLYGPTIHGQDIAVEKDMGEEREKCVGKHAIWECRNHGKHNPFTSIHHMRTLDPGLIGTAYFFYFFFYLFEIVLFEQNCTQFQNRIPTRQWKQSRY